LGGVNDSEDSDESIGETGVQVLLVLGPDEGGATDLGLGSLLVVEGGGFVSVDEALVWEVIDSDSVLGTNDEPEELGSEKDDVNWGLSVDLLEVSSFNKVPDVDLSVSSTGSDEVGVWSQVEGVDLSVVSNEGVLKLHCGVVPDLDGSVPGGRDDDWGLDVVEVSDAGNPVVVWVLVDGELADTVDVPDLQVLVHGSGSDLSIVWGEGNREDISLVTDEGLSGLSGLQVPESDGSVP